MANLSGGQETEVFLAGFCYRPSVIFLLMYSRYNMAAKKNTEVPLIGNPGGGGICGGGGPWREKAGCAKRAKIPMSGVGAIFMVR